MWLLLYPHFWFLLKFWTKFYSEGILDVFSFFMIYILSLVRLFIRYTYVDIDGLSGTIFLIRFSFQFLVMLEEIDIILRIFHLRNLYLINLVKLSVPKFDTLIFSSGYNYNLILKSFRNL